MKEKGLGTNFWSFGIRPEYARKTVNNIKYHTWVAIRKVTPTCRNGILHIIHIQHNV